MTHARSLGGNDGNTKEAMIKKKKKSSRRGALAYIRGQRAELFCCIVLILKGYKILARRYKTHQGEIDIVATRGTVLAFIEVKARPNLAQAAEAVSSQQQARLSRTASLFLAHYRGNSQHTMRFDVMLILPWHWPIHIENAFQARIRI